MASHVLMLTWPSSEARDRNTPDEQLEKFDTIKGLAKLASVDVESLLWTMGRFDAVVTVDGNQERVASFARALSRLGGIRTETLAGFDAATGARIDANAARIIGGDDLGPPGGN